MRCTSKYREHQHLLDLMEMKEQTEMRKKHANKDGVELDLQWDRGKPKEWSKK